MEKIIEITGPFKGSEVQSSKVETDGYCL